MSDIVIKIDNLSKIYRLGEVGTGTLSHDLNCLWRMNIRGQEDPYAKIGQENDNTTKEEKGELVEILHDFSSDVKHGELIVQKQLIVLVWTLITLVILYIY